MCIAKRAIADNVMPGRTAPTFINDLEVYDFRHPTPSGLNVLTDPPTRWMNIGSLGELLPENSCPHNFSTKTNQSQAPLLDARPQPDSIYRISAVCQKCRTHIQIIVDYTVRWRPGPCPNLHHPLHHLVHSPWKENVARNGDTKKEHNANGLIYAFECSSDTCSASVYVHLTPPRLLDMHVRTLTDKRLLEQRTSEAFETQAGHLEGMKHPSPVEVLSDLRAYVRNAWGKESRPINLENKRFIVRFGPQGHACSEVLEYIGFTLEVCPCSLGHGDRINELTSNLNQPRKCWRPPRPNLEDSTPYLDPSNLFLDDVEQELSILMLQRPAQERQLAQDNTSLPGWYHEVCRSLSCQACISFPILVQGLHGS